MATYNYNQTNLDGEMTNNNSAIEEGFTAEDTSC